MALSIGYGGQRSGRVREVPDARVIRYYGTLGLVDRPDLEGRTALYGKRHLEQIVAIKRLQADGHPLSEVQRRLTGVNERELARIARLPVEALAETISAAPQQQESDAEPAMRGQAFWTERPAAPAETHRERSPRYGGEAAEHGKASAHRERSPEYGAGAAPLAIRLAPGVVLVVEAKRAASEAEVEAIRQAAAPLLELMTRSALTGGK